MSHNYGFDNPHDGLSMNYFIIREVYRYMAGSIDGIIDAMPKFYDYLNIDENGCEKLVGTDSDLKEKLKLSLKVKPLLIECGFSDTFFRSYSPRIIEMSDNLFNKTYEYLFINNNNILSEEDLRLLAEWWVVCHTFDIN